MTQSVPGGPHLSFGSPQWTVIFPALLLLFLVNLSVIVGAQSSGPIRHGSASHPDANGYVGNEACAPCHASIYESYKRTPMAHASGPATEGLAPATFSHIKSGVHYRIYTEGGSAWLSFDRPGDPAIEGKRELLYFIGSGRRGRTYLFSVDGFLFESPVNWYAARHEHGPRLRRDSRSEARKLQQQLNTEHPSCRP
jgi:hypothetical protein